MHLLDELIQKIQKNDSNTTWKDVWKYVFQLEKIYVAIKPPETEQEKETLFFFTGHTSYGSTIFAFTDLEHYEIFEKNMGSSIDLPFKPKELSMQEFLYVCQNLTEQKLNYVSFNYLSDYGFHVEVERIVPMFNRFIHHDHVKEEVIRGKTKIEVAIPDELDEMKRILNQIKGNYRTVLHALYPLLVRIGQDIHLTLVMEYKKGLPDSLKRKLIQDLNGELTRYPVFQTKLYFTEELSLLPPHAKPFLRIPF